MSTIVNYPSNFLIKRGDYVNKTAADMYQRFQVESSVLPCIYNGLSVTSGGGFVANISAGTARGQDIQFTQMPVSSFEPTNVVIGASTVTIPSSTSGWIVLNININPGPTTVPGTGSGQGTYNVQADDNGGTPVVGPVFVTSLQPAIGAVYPYTQVVLAAVVTNGSGITSIDMTIGTNRSFDWADYLSNSSPYIKTWVEKNNTVTSSNVIIDSASAPAYGTGTLLMHIDIEPKYTTTELIFSVYIPFIETNDGDNSPVIALYNDTTSSFIGATLRSLTNQSGDMGTAMPMSAEFSVPSFSGSQSFSVYIGHTDPAPDPSNPILLSSIFGSVQYSILKVDEIINSN